MNVAGLLEVASGWLITSWLAAALWLVCMLALALGAGRRRGALRHGICCAALVGMWAVPAVSWMLRDSPWHWASLRAIPAWALIESAGPQAGRNVATSVTTTPRSSTPHELNSADPIDTRAPSTQASTQPAAPRAIETITQAPVNEAIAAPRALGAGAIVTFVWLAGSVWSLARLLRGHWQWRQIWKRAPQVESEPVLAALLSAAADSGMKVPCPARTTDELVTAAVGGLWRPGILIPEAWLASVPADRLSQVLSHECAHASQSHLLWLGLQKLTEALWWPQPLLLLLRRLLEASRETVCDNHVLLQHDAADYAETLVDLASQSPPTRAIAGGVAFFGHSRSFSRRVEALLDERADRRTRLSRWGHGLLIAGAALAILSVSTIRWESLTASEPAKSKPSPAAPAAAAPTADPQPVDAAGVKGEIRGRVVHADGQPASNAEVRLQRKTGDGNILPLKTQRVPTDANGEFVYPGLAPGNYRIVAFAGNESSRSKRYEFKKVVLDAQGKQTEPLELALVPLATLKVRVTSASTGKPLSDALLRFRWTDTDDNLVANERGEISVPALTNENWHVEVMAPGHACVFYDLKINSPETTLDVSLEPGGVVTGRLVDEQGQPMVNVRVSIQPPGSSMYRFDEVETGDDGRYRLQYAPLNVPIVISSWHKGYDSKQLQVAITDGTTLVKGDDIQMLKPAEGGTVAGQVVDRAGNPIVGAKLSNVGRSTADERNTQTDSDGRFRIEGLYLRHNDDVHLSVRAASFAPQELVLNSKRRDPQTPLRIVLDPGHKILARVINQKKQPVQATVFYAGGDYGFSGIGGRMDTDREGRFASDSLPPECTFSIRASGYSELVQHKLPLDGNDVVEVTLVGEGILAGQIVDARSGQPVPEFNVRITFPSERKPGDKNFGGLRSSKIEQGEDFVSAQGQFSLEPLVEGSVLDMVVRAKGYRPKRLPRVVASAAGPDRSLSIKLVPLFSEELVTIAGRILDPTGAPVADVKVHLMGTDPGDTQTPFFTWYALMNGGLTSVSTYLENRSVRTGSQGEFSFAGVPRYLSLVLYYWSESVPATSVGDLQRMPVNELGHLVLTHPGGVTVQGTIDRKAFPDASAVTVQSGRPEDFLMREMTLDKDQREFTFYGVSAGPIEIFVRGKPWHNDDFPGGGGFTVPNIASKKLMANPGESINVDIAKSDAMPTRDRK